jgi:hypothetical protein
MATAVKLAWDLPTVTSCIYRVPVPLCEVSDKIPEVTGPLLIFSISLVRLNAEPGKKKSKYSLLNS